MPMKINMLSKPNLAEENRISRSNGKIEPVSQQVGGFLQEFFPRIKALFSGTSLTLKDSTEYRHQPPDQLVLAQLLCRSFTNFAVKVLPPVCDYSKASH
jgi:hypothetical protein